MATAKRTKAVVLSLNESEADVLREFLYYETWPEEADKATRLNDIHNALADGMDAEVN